MLPGSYPHRKYLVCMLGNIILWRWEEMLPIRDDNRTTEDRATQPMEAGGWVSQFLSESFSPLVLCFSVTWFYVIEGHLWLNVIEGTSQALQNSSCLLFSALPEFLIFSLVKQGQATGPVNLFMENMLIKCGLAPYQPYWGFRKKSK